MLNTILFDLDGTLVPFNQNEFIPLYTMALSKKVAEYGYDPAVFMKTLWKGTEMMLKNDGLSTNYDRFWQTLKLNMGEKAFFELEPITISFYKNEFDTIKSVVLPHENRRNLIDMLKSKGYVLILATNPLFPPAAVETRLKWINLSPSDFSYITTYDNSFYCKPNLKYYLDICEKNGILPENCMMVGNNPTEDMCAKTLGMDVFYINEFPESHEAIDVSAIKQGSYGDFCKYAETLRYVNGKINTIAP